VLVAAVAAGARLTVELRPRHRRGAGFGGDFAAQAVDPRAHAFVELRELEGGVDQIPVDGALAADAFGEAREVVGPVAADLALVADPGEAAGAGQHAEQRDFGQADRRAAVVDEHDLVAGERELVAAAARDAVAGGEVLLVGGGRGVFDREPRLVGELAEVDLEGVRARREHHDVGAGAEDAVLAARDDHDLDAGVFEAQAVDGVGEFDVDEDVVAVELEHVGLAGAVVLDDVHHQPGDVAVDGELPVAVGVGVGLERLDPHRLPQGRGTSGAV
jgi:hypothetical protein